MWHTDYKLLKDGRWPMPYMDDASRFITGYGVFGRATGANAIAVLHDAIRRNGRPASILSDRGARVPCQRGGEQAADAETGEEYDVF